MTELTTLEDLVSKVEKTLNDLNVLRKDSGGAHYVAQRIVSAVSHDFARHHSQLLEVIMNGDFADRFHSHNLS